LGDDSLSPCLLLVASGFGIHRSFRCWRTFSFMAEMLIREWVLVILVDVFANWRMRFPLSLKCERLLVESLLGPVRMLFMVEYVSLSVVVHIVRRLITWLTVNLEAGCCGLGWSL